MADGILNVYKEKGYTSHDVVARLRGILKIKKIGHTGTLDPEAEGVLPICVGKATKLCEFLTEKEKGYEAVMVLGLETDTQDTTGTVLARAPEEAVSALTEEKIEKTLLSFEGDYDQIPPMYSALKVNGKKLYELARQGKEVERKARRVSLCKMEILELKKPFVHFRVFCSKGTYIRTLCHDVGKALGTGGCMTSLLRIQSGNFLLSDSIRLQEIEEIVQAGKLEEYLIPVDRVFSRRKKLLVTEAGEKLLYNGNPLLRSQVIAPEGEDLEDLVRVYDREGHFTGLYQYNKERGRYWPVKLFL